MPADVSPEQSPAGPTGWSATVWALCGLGLLLVAGVGLLVGYFMVKTPVPPAAQVAPTPLAPTQTNAAPASLPAAASQPATPRAGLAGLMPESQSRFTQAFAEALDAMAGARKSSNAVVVEKQQAELDAMLRRQADFTDWVGIVQRIDKAASIQDQTELLLDLGTANTGRATPNFFFCEVAIAEAQPLRAYLYDADGKFLSAFETLRPGDIVRFSGQLPSREFSSRYALPERIAPAAPAGVTLDQLQGSLEDLIKVVGQEAAKRREGESARPGTIVVPLELQSLVKITQ